MSNLPEIDFHKSKYSIYKTVRHSVKAALVAQISKFMTKLLHK